MVKSYTPVVWGEYYRKKGISISFIAMGVAVLASGRFIEIQCSIQQPLWILRSPDSARIKKFVIMRVHLLLRISLVTET
jgi:hypothetical protein